MGVWFVANWPAVARNVAVVEPAGTVTEPGTLNAVKLDARFTVAPVEVLTVTLQLLELPGIRVVGLHAMALTVTAGAAAVIVPPLAVTVTADPVRSAPTGLMSPIAALLLPENVAVMVATIPLEIVFALIPEAMQI